MFDQKLSVPIETEGGMLGSCTHSMRHPTLLVTRPCQFHLSNVTLTDDKFLRQVPHKKVPKPIRQSLFIFAKLIPISLEPVYLNITNSLVFPCTLRYLFLLCNLCIVIGKLVVYNTSLFFISHQSASA